MKKEKRSFLMGKFSIGFFLMAVLLTFCSKSSGPTGPEIPDYEIYYFNASNFDAGEDSTGTIIIIFKNASNEDEQIETEVPDEDTTLYEQNGYKLELKSTGDVYYTWPITGGSKTYAVNPGGIVVEHEKENEENTYLVYFIDQRTGNIEYAADIIENEGSWTAEFRAPINENIPLSRTTDPFSFTYHFAFDNAAGDGEILFRTDSNGYITKTEFMS